MSDLLARVTGHGLVGEIGLGRVGLPDTRRPFLRRHAGVRNPFDTKLCVRPIGYLSFGQVGTKGAP